MTSEELKEWEQNRDLEKENITISASQQYSYLKGQQFKIQELCPDDTTYNHGISTIINVWEVPGYLDSFSISIRNKNNEMYMWTNIKEIKDHTNEIEILFIGEIPNKVGVLTLELVEDNSNEGVLILECVNHVESSKNTLHPEQSTLEILEELSSCLPESEKRTDLKEVAEFLDENKGKSFAQLIMEYPEMYPHLLKE